MINKNFYIFDNYSLIIQLKIYKIFNKTCYEYKINPNKNINLMLEIINIISNYVIIEYNNFSLLSKEEIIEGIVLLSKSYDKMQYM